MSGSPTEKNIPLKVPTVEDLLRRSADNSADGSPTDYRSHLALELIADALIGLLAELQKPEEGTVWAPRGVNALMLRPPV